MITEYLLNYINWNSRLGSKLVNLYLDHTRDIINVMHEGFNSVFSILIVITAIASAIYILLSLASFFSDNKRSFAQVSDDKAPFVAIHIPTRNEACAIDCAKACLNNDYPKNKMHIYIGDDSDKKEVSLELKAFADKYNNISYYKRDNNTGFKPGNLNNLLKHTTEEIIVVFDSDFLPGKNFLRTLVSPLVADDKLQGVQARWVPRNWNKSFSASLATALNEVFHQLAMPVMHKYFNSVVLCGSAEAVRTKTLKKLGGWKAGSLTEDIEYSIRLLVNDWKIEYLYNLTCSLEVPYTPKDYFRQQMRWAYGVVTSISIHIKDLIRKKTKQVSPKPIAGILILGYTLTVLLVGLFITGTLSFITHPPGPMNLPLFFKETLLNILITSGLILSFIIALIRARKITLLPRAVISSLTIGIVTTMYVSVGVYRSLTGGNMKWYLLKKTRKKGSTDTLN